MKLLDARAFLVRLSDRSEPSTDRWVGRVEHVETGLQRRFTSYEELRDFVAQLLADEETYEEDPLTTTGPTPKEREP